MATAQDTRILFRRHFEALPLTLAHGPGRLEILGNRADTHQGIALAAACEAGAWVAAGHRNDGRVRIISSHFHEQSECFIDRIAPDPAAPWADLPKSIVEQVIRRGANCTGFNLLIHSNLPIRRGFGSSGAVASATLLALRALFRLRFQPRGKLHTLTDEEDIDGALIKTPEKIELARVCRDAEAQTPGLPGGLAEPLASFCGKRGHLALMDFMHETVRTIPMPPGCVLVAAELPGRSDSFSDEELIAQNAGAAAAILGLESLRRADPDMVAARKHLLSGAEAAIASHLAGENRRVVAAERALEQGDAVRFGECLSLSHLSQRELLKTGSPALDSMAAFAKSLPACLGAGVTGRGEGSSLLCLVQHELAADFMRTLTEEAAAQVGMKLNLRVCIPADGAMLEPR